jgi:hypothetical protein
MLTVLMVVLSCQVLFRRTTIPLPAELVSLVLSKRHLSNYGTYTGKEGFQFRLYDQKHIFHKYTCDGKLNFACGRNCDALGDFCSVSWWFLFCGGMWSQIRIWLSRTMDSEDHVVLQKAMTLPFYIFYPHC